MAVTWFKCHRWCLWPFVPTKSKPFNNMRTEKYPEKVFGESKYVDYDEATGMWCIFGADSGHAYGSFASEEDADESLLGA